MAVDVTLKNVKSGYNTNTINENFVQVQDALQDSVSRSGSVPNNMEADLDLDSNDLLNGGSAFVEELYIGGELVVPGDMVISNTLIADNNLSDVESVTASRTNLDVYSRGEVDQAIADAISQLLLTLNLI